MARQPVVLEMLFQAAPAHQGSTNLLIFSLLVPFIHRDGAIGQQARDALLLVMAASASHEVVARYIAENSYFCPVRDSAPEKLYSGLITSGFSFVSYSTITCPAVNLLFSLLMQSLGMNYKV